MLEHMHIYNFSYPDGTFFDSTQTRKIDSGGFVADFDLQVGSKFTLTDNCKKIITTERIYNNQITRAYIKKVNAVFPIFVKINDGFSQPVFLYRRSILQFIRDQDMQYSTNRWVKDFIYRLVKNLVDIGCEDSFDALSDQRIDRYYINHETNSFIKDIKYGNYPWNRRDDGIEDFRSLMNERVKKEPISIANDLISGLTTRELHYPEYWLTSELEDLFAPILPYTYKPHAYDTITATCIQDSVLEKKQLNKLYTIFQRTYLPYTEFKLPPGTIQITEYNSSLLILLTLLNSLPLTEFKLRYILPPKDHICFDQLSFLYTREKSTSINHADLVENFNRIFSLWSLKNVTSITIVKCYSGDVLMTLFYQDNHKETYHFDLIIAAILSQCLTFEK